MRLGRLALLSLALALSTGCATVESGRAFDTLAAESFQEGKTTRQQIEASLGKPTSVATLGDGRTVLTYSHIVSHANGLTGASNAGGTMATFVVDAQGVLSSKTITRTDNRTKID